MKNILMTVLVSILATSAYAGDDHNHEAAVEPAPHGGMLRDAPPYKAELVLDKDQAKVYIYEKKGEKLVPAQLPITELKGDVRLPKEKKSRPITFKKNGDVFEGSIAGISKVHRFDLHMHFEEKGKKVVLDFGVDNIH